MTSRDDDPTGWKEVEKLIGFIKDGPRYWGEVVGELEALVSSHGTVVLCKEYRRKGANLELPWVELTEAELRGLLSRGEELLQAIAAAKIEGGTAS